VFLESCGICLQVKWKWNESENGKTCL